MEVARYLEAILRTAVWGGAFLRIVGRGGCSRLAVGRLRVFFEFIPDVIHVWTLKLSLGWSVWNAGLVKRDRVT